MDAATAWAEAMKFENRPNPYPYYEELRKTPVAKVSEKTYVVTGYPEAVALAHDPRISSDISRSPSGMFGERRCTSNRRRPPRARSEHAGLRPARARPDAPPVHAAFRPAAHPDLIPSMGAMVEDLANSLLDKVAARGGTRMDVVEDFSYPIPVSVIFRVMGAPIEDEPKFHGWVTDFLQGADLGPEADTEAGRAAAAKAVASAGELDAYVRDLVARLARRTGARAAVGGAPRRRPRRPGVDRGGGVQHQLLLVAGHDSTVNTLSNCIMTLLRNQGAWDLVRDNPDLIPRTVEEVQRLQGAVQFFPSRWATADIEIGGTRIPAGSAVFLVWAAANRDPRQFENPDRFDPMRTDNEHLGFGSGIHTCFGGPLARLEINIALRSSCAGALPGWWSTRRRTGTTRCSAGPGTCGWISPRSTECRCRLAVWTGELPQALDRFSPLTRSWFAGTFVQPTPAQAQAWSAIANGDNTLRDRPDRVGQDTGGVPVGDRPVGAPTGCPEHEGAVRLAAQGPGRRRRTQPAHPTDRHHPHRRTRRAAGAADQRGVRSGDTRRPSAAN